MYFPTNLVTENFWARQEAKRTSFVESKTRRSKR